MQDSFRCEKRLAEQEIDFDRSCSYFLTKETQSYLLHMSHSGVYSFYYSPYDLYKPKQVQLCRMEKGVEKKDKRDIKKFLKKVHSSTIDTFTLESNLCLMGTKFSLSPLLSHVMTKIQIIEFLVLKKTFAKLLLNCDRVQTLSFSQCLFDICAVTFNTVKRASKMEKLRVSCITNKHGALLSDESAELDILFQNIRACFGTKRFCFIYLNMACTLEGVNKIIDKYELEDIHLDVV
ncbi:unnamed protein product [Moneuplotes crassus]|uniref:Uncharacterized protein n=1 Tax=Euplotes crassus TaxID=5936 RepID=A0AAD1XSR7_EUPCR|nr:unnamed protein product [Moneuplotes crassus]